MEVVIVGFVVGSVGDVECFVYDDVGEWCLVLVEGGECLWVEVDCCVFFCLFVDEKVWVVFEMDYW